MVLQGETSCSSSSPGVAHPVVGGQTTPRGTVNVSGRVVRLEAQREPLEAGPGSGTAEPGATGAGGWRRMEDEGEG